MNVPSNGDAPKVLVTKTTLPGEKGGNAVAPVANRQQNDSEIGEMLAYRAK